MARLYTTVDEQLSGDIIFRPPNQERHTFSSVQAGTQRVVNGLLAIRSNNADAISDAHFRAFWVDEYEPALVDNARYVPLRAPDSDTQEPILALPDEDQLVDVDMMSNGGDAPAEAKTKSGSKSKSKSGSKSKSKGKFGSNSKSKTGSKSQSKSAPKPKPTLAQRLRAEGENLADDFKDDWDTDSPTSQLAYKLALANAGTLTGLSGSDNESGSLYSSYPNIRLSQKTRHFRLHHTDPSPSVSSISDVVVDHEADHFQKRKSPTVTHYPERLQRRLNRCLQAPDVSTRTSDKEDEDVDDGKPVTGRFCNRRRCDPSS